MIFVTLLAAGLAQGAMYALIALGLVLIYKTQDVVNFAHGEIFMLAAFGAYVLIVYVGLSYWLTFLIVVPLAALLGAVVERVLIRKVADRSHITLAMVTVGMSFALQGLARIPFGSDIYSMPPVNYGSGTLAVGGFVIATQSVIVIAITLAIGAGVAALFQFTKMGRRMRATQQSATGAKIVGINVGMMFMLTWALAAGIGAVAGILAGPITLLYPDVGAKFLLKGFAAAVLGGFNSVVGAVIGGFSIGVVEIMFGAYVSSSFQEVSAFVMIIIVLLLRPQGLLGQKETTRV